VNQIFNKIKDYFFLLPLVFFVVLTYPRLSLPYFWDEAWSYFPAVFKMYENGPGLMPGALSLWEAKGHPLFFFFLSSSWMRLVGTSVFWVHILPFLISLTTLGALFALVKKHAGIWAANISILLFSVQSLFLAQATFLLPEMLITLLLLFSVHFYLAKKYWLFALSASVMVLTKETSIVFIAGFLLFHLFIYLKPGKESRKYILESLLISIPILIYALFLVLHKKEFGSFFFQEHTGYIELSLTSVLRKIKMATNIVYNSYGRKFILFAVVVALGFIFIKKKKLENKNVLALLLLLSLLFIIFSAFNFYTQRYMLCILALFITITSILFIQARFKQWYLNLIIVGLVTAAPLYYTLAKKTNSDSDLGYVHVVKLHKEMVKYCEEQNWQDKPISASFNLIFCLRNPHLGYVSSNEGFSQVMNLKKYQEAEIFLNDCTSFGEETQIDSIASFSRVAKEFEREQAWGKIYTKLP